jgi:hypothetical protein
MSKLDTGVEDIHETLQQTLGVGGYFDEQERNELNPQKRRGREKSKILKCGWNSNSHMYVQRPSNSKNSNNRMHIQIP